LSQIGFDAGNGVAYYMLPGSGTHSVLNLAKSSNVGLNGRWIFRIDGINVQLPTVTGVQ